MQVCDNGCPARCSPIRMLTVNVNRNRNRPVFVSASYTATISEEALYGSSVHAVSAQDLDFLVSALHGQPLSFCRTINPSALSLVEPCAGLETQKRSHSPYIAPWK